MHSSGANHPNQRTTRADVELMSRAQVIAWLEWNDPNGDYRLPLLTHCPECANRLTDRMTMDIDGRTVPTYCDGCDGEADVTFEQGDAIPTEELRECAMAQLAEDTDLTRDGRVWTIKVLRLSDGTENTRDLYADSLREALTLAARMDAGTADYAYGILPDDYAQAMQEGIAFNEADGLLI